MESLKNVRRVVIYLLTCFLIFNTSLPPVLAAPSGGDFKVGTGDIVYGTNTVVTVNQIESVIEWGAPGTGGIDTVAGESLSFLQAEGLGLSNSAVLNRIMSGNQTQFDGVLNGLDMRIFIVNPAGIVFGEGSSVNVTQLVASGLNMSNEAFHNAVIDPTQDMIFQGGDGIVKNYKGIINAESVYLVGKKVINMGSIIAGPGGLVVMAAGDNVYLGQNGSNVLVEIEADPMDPTADIANEGSITADNGTIVLAAGDTFSRAIINVGTLAGLAGTITASAARIENSGTINADAVDGDEGAISLTVSEAIVLNKGSMTTADGGELIIDAPELTIADGYIPAEPRDNTLYEKWVEEQSQAGTDLELVANSSKHGNIIVENISDGEITGGSGDIALRTKYYTGGIKFLPASEDGPVMTTIHTTSGGSVYMLAGEGGITVGNIITEVPSNDKLTEPGKIRLFTNNYGNIETGKLTVKGGSYDEVSIIACGNLTIKGNIETITNQVPSDIKEVGQARTCLVSIHGNVEIDGAVIVRAHGKYYSTADIHICAGENVTITLGPEQRIDASAHTSESGPAEASILIHAGKNMEGPGVISINGGGSNPIHVYAKAGGGTGTAEVYSSDDPADWDETVGNAHALLEIDDNRTAECPDCPTPPDIPPPIPPMALPDVATTHMGKSVSGNVLDNDTPSEEGELFAILIDEPEHGVLLTFDADTGDYTYKPDAGYVGTDTFTYAATDGTDTTDPILVTITVTNDLPDVTDDAWGTHMGDTVSGNVLENDTDTNLDPLTVVLDGTSPAHGDLVLNDDGSFTYEPDDGYVGEDSFTYEATDGQLDELGNPVVVTATVTITMGNDSPVLTDDAWDTHMGDTVSGNVLENDTDKNLDPLTVVLDGTAPAHGDLVLNDDGSFTYEPDDGYVGEDTFTYEATDGELDEFGAPVVVVGTVTITMGNNPPTPVDDTATTIEGVPVSGNVLTNDTDPDLDKLTVVLNGTEPMYGDLVLNEDGTFTYTPDAGFDGTDSFTYLVTDGEEGKSVVATVTITVNPGKEPPPPPPTPALPYLPPAPGLERIEIEVSGCPALLTWAAGELGINARMMEIWIANALASTRDIQPCDACARLKAAATIMQDAEGTHIAALAQVINEFASSTAPPTEEQMASIADAIARNAEGDNQYALAGAYLDALAEYVGILNSEMNFSAEESITFAADRYVLPLAESENIGVAAYVGEILAALGG